jgi:hypothetical protein
MREAVGFDGRRLQPVSMIGLPDTADVVTENGSVLPQSESISQSPSRSPAAQLLACLVTWLALNGSAGDRASVSMAVLIDRAVVIGSA